MMRTQISLPTALYQRIAEVAQQAHQPKAQVIRDLLSAGIAHVQTRQQAGAALLRLTRLGLRAEPDLSARVDEYLYVHP
jgi:predicted DNA-binding protein